ncbi:MAG: alpha/beta hydrolase, partial [Clostridiaceae bacterium]
EEGRLPVVYLLHGYTDDHTTWCKNTKIELYAQEYQVAVVMPDAGKSLYTDMAYGDAYFTYITKEVPEYVTKWFPISRKKEYNFLAGNSMGGYGAMKFGLNYPERFNAVASFSSALVVSQMAQFATMEMPANFPDFMKHLLNDVKFIFNDLSDIANCENDPCWLVKNNIEQGKKLPRLYLSCGTNDFIYPFTKGFKDFLSQLSVECEYSEEPETHNWRYWDRQLDSFLKWAIKK